MSAREVTRDFARRMESLRLRLDAVNYLKSVKRLLNVTYRDLSVLLSLPESVLSRYVTGDMLPSPDTAGRMLAALERAYPLSSIIKTLVRTYETYVDMSFANLPELWELYGIYLSRRFPELKVDVVLTAAVDGVPLAVVAASRLSARLVVAKQYREPGVANYEYTLLREGRPVTLYIPATQIGRGDRAFVVDDIARTGRTLEALANLAQAAGARVVGASVLMAREGLALRLSFPVDVVLRVPV